MVPISAKPFTYRFHFIAAETSLFLSILTQDTLYFDGKTIMKMFCSMRENQGASYLGCLKCEFDEGQKWLFKVLVSLYSLRKISENNILSNAKQNQELSESLRYI